MDPVVTIGAEKPDPVFLNGTSELKRPVREIIDALKFILLVRSQSKCIDQIAGEVVPLKGFIFIQEFCAAMKFVSSALRNNIDEDSRNGHLCGSGSGCNLDFFKCIEVEIKIGGSSR